jgi:hypothetical protein
VGERACTEIMLPYGRPWSVCGNDTALQFNRGQRTFEGGLWLAVGRAFGGKLMLLRK